MANINNGALVLTKNETEYLQGLLQGCFDYDDKTTVFRDVATALDALIASADREDEK